MSDPAPWQWTNFKEARDAIALMPLRDLEQLSGLKYPWLFPLSGWAAGLGPVLYLAGGKIPLLQLLGPLVLGYGILALLLNKSRAADYRIEVYKQYVQQKVNETDTTEGAA